MGAKYKEIETNRLHNRRVERAKDFAAAYNDKLRGIQAELEIGINTAEKINSRREKPTKKHN